MNTEVPAMEDSFGIGDVQSELAASYRRLFANDEIAATMTAYVMDLLFEEVDRQCRLRTLFRSSDPAFNAWLSSKQWC